MKLGKESEMVKIYANLIGEWVCLNSDPNCRIGENGVSPSIWWEENAEIWSPTNRGTSSEHRFYDLDYVHIYYEGKDYRINPIFIQIVTE